ncbi:TonB-dependent receptor [Sphingomonas sp.]|uniref:TonB-dependent receptor n=1 Tax=Sphingomonas sp. TaxID=28214 RepID=UPI00286A244A|nr:TonB-dependent receptor [Sphingomonas sp.]
MRKSIWLLSAGLTVLSTPAFAQTTTAPPATPSEAPLEAASVDSAAQAAEAVDSDAIIVTATRRSEALSDVPLAVSAISADTIKNSGAVDLRGLNQVSPSLLVSSTSSEAGAGGARIRGIGTVGDNPGLESSVAIFIDGVYRSRIGTGLTELGPVERVEVLRGPQGTLFGRNASSGLIHVITSKPKFTTEAYGEATIGNYNLRRIDLGVTGPITDTIAARIDGVYMKRDGFLKDVISGDRVNDRSRYLLRGQILYQPTDSLSVRLIGDYSKRNEECCAAVYLPTRDFTATGPNTGLTQPSTIARIERGLGAIINDDPYDRDVSITPGRSYNSDVVDYGLSAEINYDFGGAELTSITAYRFNELQRGQDADFNNLDILYRDGSGGSANRFKTFTQELRLQGKAFGDRLDWLVGGFFMSEKLRVKDNLSYGADYSRYANCLVANNFVNGTGQPALLQTSSPTCFNSAVASGVRSALEAQFLAAAGNAPLQAAIAGQFTVLSAFARLPADAFVTTNFSGAPFVNSGFSNLSGLQTFSGVGTEDEYNQTDTNFSAFTHNIISLTDRLKLTLGVRFTHDKKDLDAQLRDNNTLCAFFSGSATLNSLQTLPCVIPSAPGGSYSDSDTKKENKWTGTAVLSWKPVDEILVYGSFSRGYKAGGFNLDRAALPRSRGNGAILSSALVRSLQFNPEINNAFELGMKYNGRGIDINLALFRQDFKDFQLNTFNGLNFEVATVNSCGDSLGGADTDSSSLTGACNGKIKSGVRSQGAELEIFTRPFRNARINAGLTYVQTKYKQELVGANGAPLSNQLFQLPGRNLSNAPELSVTGSFSWTPPIGSNGLRGLLYVDARHVSSFNTGSDLDIEKNQAGFSVVNGRLGLTGRDGMWGVELWVQNMFNANYKQVAFDSPLQGSCTERGAQAGYCTALLPGTGFPNRATQLFSAFLGEPRTFGMTLKAKFRAARPVEAAPPVVELPPPPPPPAATQTCADGTVILASDACPPPPPPPPPPPEPEKG